MHIQSCIFLNLVMPIYSVEQLVALKESDLVVVPEFKWNEIEKVSKGIHAHQAHGDKQQGSWRRGSHSSQNSKRPTVMPKAAIPFSQRALFDNKNSGVQSAAVEDTEDLDSDDDEFAARYLLKSKPKPKKQSAAADGDGAPVVNLSYAAALAASMKMSEAASEAEAAAEEGADAEDGWLSVSHQGKGRKIRNNRGSFSKWRV